MSRAVKGVPVLGRPFAGNCLKTIIGHNFGVRGDKMSEQVRVGAVSYLNTKPLVYGLAKLAPQAEVTYDLPSRLADDLANGVLDVALIPSIEFFQDPAYAIISDACIGCRGPVLSVKLLSRVPLEQIDTLALGVER